jgi:hypothetical protein
VLITMPDRDVSTLRDIISYRYAKIIACSEFGRANGVEAKKKHYGYIGTSLSPVTAAGADGSP